MKKIEKTIALRSYQKDYKWEENGDKYQIRIVVRPSINDNRFVISTKLSSDNLGFQPEIQSLSIRKETLKHLSDLLVAIVGIEKL